MYAGIDLAELLCVVLLLQLCYGSIQILSRQRHQHNIKVLGSQLLGNGLANACSQSNLHFPRWQ